MRRHVLLALSGTLVLALIGFGVRVLAQEEPEGSFNGDATHQMDGSTRIGNDDGKPDHYVIHKGDHTTLVHNPDGTWAKRAGDGCKSNFETHTDLECYPDGDGDPFWTRVTYDEYTCTTDPTLRRIVIAQEPTSERCSDDDYNYWKAAVYQQWGEVWNPDPAPPEPPPPPPPPPSPDDIPPVGKLKPVLVGHFVGECPSSVIWQDEEGHQYVASYDAHGVGKWETPGPSEPPPPIPHHVGNQDIPDCPPLTNMTGPRPPGGGDRKDRGDDTLKDILGHVTIGVGVGGGHDDHHDRHDTPHEDRPATKPGG
jgi:hypothetical protein